MDDANPEALNKVSSGIEGLDAILEGGFPRSEMHVVRGGAGSGKTTLGLQFLMEGAANGEKVLFLTLSQTESALRKIASSHGWSLDGVDVREHGATDGPSDAAEQTLFHTADVELGEMMSSLLAEIGRHNPDRIVLDSIGQIRQLADTPLRYQRQLLKLRNCLVKLSASVLIVDSSQDLDEALADLSHGMIELARNVPDYGNARRRLCVTKMRGTKFHGGNHNFRIRTGGLEIYPRLEPEQGEGRPAGDAVKSGVKELDALLGGGLDEGTACMIAGATGTGKTSLATLYAHAAARRGERAAVFSFDERPDTFFKRSEGLGMDLRPLVEKGLFTLRTVNTAELSPGEFSQLVREAVEHEEATVVVIDSLTGYFHAMPQEDTLITQMHDLLAFLSQRGVLSLLVVGQHGMLGERVQGPVEVSYLADTVLVIRHFEAFGEVRKAVSVLKKRHGPHETTVRELLLNPGSIEVSQPISEFSGLLSGRPEFRGRGKDLRE